MAGLSDEASLREWLRTWGDCVARVDFEAARPLFAHDVLGFGTRAEVADGLELLVADQWRHVWPSISGFAFDVERARLFVCTDRTLAVIAATWTSIRTSSERAAVPRTGRATVVVRRESASQPWRGVHTHFSLTPADLA